MRLFAPRAALQMELIFIFGMLPAIIAIIKPGFKIIPIIWILAAMAWRTLQSHNYTWRKEWNTAALTRENVTAILRRFVPNAAAMLLFAWIVVPQRLFSLPLERPQLWLLIMALYPLLSVMPQEILYRSFFLRRYRPIIADSQMKMVNTLAFGWVHVIMQNWIAIAFCLIGGWFFTGTYQKTRSLALVCLEHALYGCFVFTVGLGVFFYHGSGN